MGSYQRQICGQSSKKQNRKNSTNSKIVHIDAKKKTATSLINTEIMAVFDSIKCQRREYIISLFFIQLLHMCNSKKAFKKAMIFFLFSENHRLYLFMTYNITENFTLQTPALTFLLEFTFSDAVPQDNE